MTRLRRRSTIRNSIEYLAALAVLATIERSPRFLAERLAAVFVWLLDLAVPRLRRVALRNLQLALPKLDAEERWRIANGVFRSIGRLLVSFARLPRIHRGNVSEHIRYEGFEHVEAAKRQGRGILFSTAHLGNWELSAFAYGLLTAPMHVVARPLDNPKLDALVTQRRTLSGNRVIEKKDFARSILKALQANEAVGILIDQNTSLEDGIFVDFFGIPACATTGIARMAAHTGAAVIPGFALWSGEERRYVLRFYQPVPMTGDLAADTQALQSRVESVIREHPDRWLWIHRRWKTRPPGCPPLY